MAAPPRRADAPAITTKRWVAPTIGLIAGLASGLLGVGGGFLAVPMLLVSAKLDPPKAVGTSLAGILPISLVGALGYYFGGRSPQADLRVALLFVIGSVVGAYLGAQLVSRVDTRVLRTLVAATLAVVGAYQAGADLLAPGLLGGGHEVQLDVVHSIAIAVAGAAIGLLSGLSGLGGGVFTVPVLALGFGLKQHLAQGTSLVALLPTAIVGSLTHQRLGNVDLRIAAWIGGVGAPAALVGASVALALPQRVLVLVFAIFMLVAAWQVRPSRAPRGSRSVS